MLATLVVGGGEPLVAQSSTPTRPEPAPAEAVQAPAADGLGVWSLRADYQTGGLSSGSAGPFDAYRIELVRQTDGSRDWHHWNRFPSYGVGAYLGRFGGSPGRELGVPVALYWFLSVPMFPVTETFDVVSTFGAGLAIDSTGERADQATGRGTRSRANAYLDLGVYGRVLMSRRLGLLAGVSASHFSNGGGRLPNRGVSLWAPRVALEYTLRQRGPRPTRRPQPFTAYWETRVTGTGGVKDSGPSVLGVGTLKGSVWRRFYPAGQLGGGLEVSLDRPRLADPLSDDAEGPPRRVGHGHSRAVYGGYEHLFGRLAFFFHLGAYVWQEEVDTRPTLYQRFGSRYQLTEHIFGSVALRFFNFGRPDYVEWGVGYRLVMGPGA